MLQGTGAPLLVRHITPNLEHSQQHACTRLAISLCLPTCLSKDHISNGRTRPGCVRHVRITGLL